MNYEKITKTQARKMHANYKEESQFEPRQRTAVDGKVWWVVYDKFSQQYSTLLCFGRYKTKKECENAIRLQKGGQQND